jgi:hypothetical protein
MQMLDQLEQQVVKEKDRLVAMVKHLKWSEEKIGIAGEIIHSEKVIVPERHFRENLENTCSKVKLDVPRTLMRILSRW